MNSGQGPNMRGDRGQRGPQYSQRDGQQWNGGGNHRNGNHWNGGHRNHSHGGGWGPGIALGWGGYGGWDDGYGYGAYASVDQCETIRVRYVRPNGRVVYRLEERCY